MSLRWSAGGCRSCAGGGSDGCCGWPGTERAGQAAPGGALPLLAALSGQWHAAVNAGHGREDVSAARLALGGQQ